MKKQLSAFVLLAAIVLVGLSFLWGRERGAWTAEQAQSYSDAAADLHRLTYEAAQVREASKAALAPGTAKDGSAKRPALPADAPLPADPRMATPQRAEAALAEAQKRYDAARAALDQARSRGGGNIILMRWLGIGLAVAGVCGLVTGGSKNDPS
jgi:hypothetical protein